MCPGRISGAVRRVGKTSAPNQSLNQLDKNPRLMCHTSERSSAQREPLPTQKLTVAEIQSLHQNHGPALAAYACCCGLDFASAQDVVQQVFLNLLRANEPAPRLPLAYAYRAVRNVSLNFLRDRRRETGLPENETWLLHSSSETRPEESLALQKSLRDLPPEQQETVFLHIWSGMTLQEIADTTETPLNTVASRYRYALEKLRVLLK